MGEKEISPIIEYLYCPMVIKQILGGSYRVENFWTIYSRFVWWSWLRSNILWFNNARTGEEIVGFVQLHLYNLLLLCILFTNMVIKDQRKKYLSKLASGELIGCYHIII